MIKKEYEKLLELLEQSTEGEGFSLEEILKRAVVFFESLRSSFPSSTKEEQEEMMAMMSHLHSKLQEISEKTAKASGMTEDELAAFAENPSNFTPEQWQIVQESRRELYDSARKFSSSMEKERKKKGIEEEGEEKPRKGIKHPTKRSKRNKWMKS